MNNLIEMYNGIQQVINANESEMGESSYKAISRIITEETQRETLQDVFKISLVNKYINAGYIDLYNDMHLVLMGENHKRTISWSDDGSQPVDEWLLSIAYPTGAYIFGDSYPVKLFQEYFIELKNLGAKFCDTKNHCLYFDSNNAKKVYDLQREILNKYNGKLKEFLEAEELIKLKKRLEELSTTKKQG
jgi:hypothetical protein